MTQQTLADEVERIIECRALGRSDLIDRLFRFLADQSLAGRSPKESEVAVHVFGRRPDFDPARDAIARVYVHKLRKKLDQLNKDAGGGRARLEIPKGQYRLVLRENKPEVAASVGPTRRRLLGLSTGTVATALVSGAVCGSLGFVAGNSHDSMIAASRRSPLWRPVLKNGRPILVALGDYYIFGDTDGGMEPRRLVREYSINSKADLDHFVRDHTDFEDRYIDLDLRYLPISVGAALSSILPLLQNDDGERSPIRIMLASELTPTMIKQSNIVYIGYFSGMGILAEPRGRASRFIIGSSYDELIDGRSSRRYVSQGGGMAPAGSVYRDYGYLSTFSGPAGGRVVMIAGARDAGVSETAEMAAAKVGLESLRQFNNAQAFEALYLVDGIDRLNVSGQLLIASAMHDEQVWNNSSGEGPKLPAG